MVPITLLQRDTHNKSIIFHFVFRDVRESTIKPDFHIVVSDGDVSQSVDRRCCWDAYDDMGTFFGDVADIPVVSPTSQSRWEKLRSVQLLTTSPMHRCHIPIDAGTSPSLTTIWKPGFKGLSWKDPFLDKIATPYIV